MSGLSRRIKQIDEELLALGEDSMLLEELDGLHRRLAGMPRADHAQRLASGRLA